MPEGSRSIRGVLFDKDGTLVDFDATWMPAYRSAAEALGELTARPGVAETLLVAGGLDPATGRLGPSTPLACASNSEIARLWAHAIGHEDAAEVFALVDEVFTREGSDRPVAVAGLEAALGALRSLGLTLGVATMDSACGAAATLARLGVEGHFDFVCGYDSGFGEKPQPGMVAGFCRRSGLDAAEVAVVGDTLHDLHMGRSAGAGLVVAVLTGASPQEVLEPHCDVILDSVVGLEAVLGVG